MNKNDSLEVESHDKSIERRLEEQYDIFHSTDGAERMWQYFQDITRKHDFLEEIYRLREKYGMPKGDHGQEIQFDIWKLSPDKRRLLTEDVNQLNTKFHLHPLEWQTVTSVFLMTNVIVKLFEDPCSGGLCSIVDMVQLTEEPFGEEITRWDNQAYPIAIRISPNASLTQIRNFITSTYDEMILPMQNKYKKQTLVAKVRKKNQKIQQRDDFIFQNRDMPRREIMRILGENGFDIIDPGHISRIISTQREMRKEH